MVPEYHACRVPYLARPFHMLTASMKGLVALSGLEAMSNGIQFVINEDAGLVKWGKNNLPKLQGCGISTAAKSALGAGTNLLPVLWRRHHFFPGLFCLPLQRF